MLRLPPGGGSRAMTAFRRVAQGAVELHERPKVKVGKRRWLRVRVAG